MTLPLPVDFMPDSVRRAVRSTRSRQRRMLLGLLLLVLSVGVSGHSWNSARRADAARAVGAQLVANQVGVDEVLDRMTAERDEIERALRITEGLRPVTTPSAVLATVTHLMPERAVLTGMRLAAEDSPRQFTVVLRGHAAGSADVQRFQASLASHPAFRSVTISESRAAQVQERNVQEFSIAFQVPLHAPSPAAPRGRRQEPVQ